MAQYAQALFLVVAAAILLWFGFALFFRSRIPAAKHRAVLQKRTVAPRRARGSGPYQTCPVCSAKLYEGESVKSAIFPSLNGGNDRFMHIKGCVYCLNGERERICPVCGNTIKTDEILICRMFERHPIAGRKRNHVHVLGCTRCRGK